VDRTEKSVALDDHAVRTRYVEYESLKRSGKGFFEDGQSRQQGPGLVEVSGARTSGGSSIRC
jgi:hypothetical protein